MRKKTTNEFIKDSKNIHGNKYNYSLVDYKNMRTKIKFICSVHGIFEQLPHNHLNGSGCFLCNGTIKKTTKQFIKESKEIHGNKYDYSLVKYTNNSTNVEIICPTHGSFKQTPKNHLNYNGCPVCSLSKGETKVINFLNTNNIKYELQKTFNDCVFKNKLRFDFYLPIFNTCIEFDGIQHFKSIEYFGGEEELYTIQQRDKIKNEYCNKNDISLLRIKYNENIENKLLLYLF